MGKNVERRGGVYIDNGMLLSRKREWNIAIRSDTRGPRDCHVEWSKSEKDKHHVISLTCEIVKKYTEMNLFMQQKQTPQI